MTMKLRIRDEYFDEILAGKKNVEFRDAHLTLIAETSGRRLRVSVEQAMVEKRISPKKLAVQAF